MIAEKRRTRTLPPLGAGGGLTWSAALAQGARSARDALAAHRGRAAMTLCGIMIGIAGVLVVDAAGQSQRVAVTAQLARLGSNVVSIAPGSSTTGGAPNGAGSRPTLTEQDARAIRAQAVHVAAVSPIARGSETVVAGSQTWATTVTGAYPDIQAIQDEAVQSGAFFTEADESAGATVAVLGPTVAARLFPDGSPVGRPMRIGSVDFRVVGVLQAKGQDASGDLDDTIVVPFKTAQQRLFGYGPVSSILLQVDDTSNIPAAITNATQAIEQSHRLPPGRPDDFTVRNEQQLVEAQEEQAGALTRALTAVAAVVLVHLG